MIPIDRQFQFQFTKQRFFFVIGVILIGFSLISCNTENSPVIPDTVTKQTTSIVTKVKTNRGRSYLEVNGKPHLSYGVHLITADLIGSSTDPVQIATIEPYFQKAADLGFKTVYLSLRWDLVEFSPKVYNFDLYLRPYLNFAYKYNLDIELSWMGSTCNGGPCAPAYIMDDQITYPRIAKDGPSWQRSMDFTNSNIVKKEQEVLMALMSYIASVDVRKRIITISTTAEPDNWSFTGTAWQSQRNAIINNMLAPLGKALQACDHRIGVKTWLGAEWQDIDAVLGTCSYDMVGFDPYSTSSAILKTSIDRVLRDNSLPNVFEATESGGHFDEYINTIITAFKEGFGYYVFELRSMTFRNYDYGIYRPTTQATNEWIERDGSQTIAYDPYGKARGKESNTAEIRLFNNMIYKADQKIAICPREQSASFNLGNTLTANETLNIGGKSILFSTVNQGCALAIIDAIDNSTIILAARGDINLKYPTPAKTISISVGAFDASNKWIEASKREVISDNIDIEAWEVTKIQSFK